LIGLVSDVDGNLFWEAGENESASLFEVRVCFEYTAGTDKQDES